MEISEETKKIEKALDENIIKLIDDVNSVWKQSNYKYQLSKELPKTTFKKSELIKGKSWGGGEYSFDTIRLDVGDNGINICVLNGEYYHASKGIWKNDNSLSYSKGGHDSISTNNIDFKFFLAANADVILNITTELTNEYLQKQQIAAEKKVQETKDFEEHSKALAEELGIEPKSEVQQLDSYSSEIAQKALGFKSFDELKAQFPNAVDLSQSEKKKMSYKEVEAYLKTIVNDVMITSDNDKIAISDNYEHVMKSSDYSRLSRRGKEEIKTYASEIEKIIPNSEFENELPNHDKHKPDVDYFKYFSVPIWINNRAYNVLLECGVLKEKDTSETQARKGVLKNVTEVSNTKYIRKNGKLQVVDISYLYNMRNRPLYNYPNNEPSKIEVDGKEIECKNGVVEGFKNAVRQNNELIKDYNSLVQDFNTLAEEMDKLRQQLQNHNHGNKPSSYS